MFRHFILPTLTVRGLTQSSSPTSVCLSALQIFVKSQSVCFCLLRPVRRLGSVYSKWMSVWIYQKPNCYKHIMTFWDPDAFPESRSQEIIEEDNRSVSWAHPSQPVISQGSGCGKHTWKTHNRKYHPFTPWPLLDTLGCPLRWTALTSRPKSPW